MRYFTRNTPGSTHPVFVMDESWESLGRREKGFLLNPLSTFNYWELRSHYVNLTDNPDNWIEISEKDILINDHGEKVWIGNLVQQEEVKPEGSLLLLSLVNEGTMCPSQWAAVRDDGEHLYIRYRNGRLTVLAESENRKIFSDVLGDDLDGYLTTEEMLAATGYKVKS